MGKKLLNDGLDRNSNATIFGLILKAAAGIITNIEKSYLFLS